MFINFTNHPSEKWSDAQKTAACVYGGIIDIPFPNVDPNGDENYIAALADTYVARIMKQNPAARFRKYVL